MGVTITKVKKVQPQAEKPELNLEVATIEELADEYGHLEDQVNAMLANPVFARFEQAKKALMDKLEMDYQPEQKMTVVGDKWILDIGAAAKSPDQISDMAKVRKFMGEQAFLQVAKVNLSDVRAYLTPAQVAQVLEPTGYTKRRKITAKYRG